MRWVLIMAALFGASSVIIGASLRHLGAEFDLDVVQTALHYHQLYSLVLLAMGLYVLDKPFTSHKVLGLSAALFICATLVFSGSLYALALLNIPALGYFTPIGGVMFIAAWSSLIFAKCRP
jgi:uncharacterized membrane protein YgdD (TMEM256/DUF423 family)